MNKSKWFGLNLALLLGFVASPTVVRAQYFTPPGNGDLMAGFRKTGAHVGTNELVVFLGNVTNLLALSPGTTITMSNIPAARLTDAFSSDYTFIQWSVFGGNYNLSTTWDTPLGSFPQSTLWYTIPRTTQSVQTQPPVRFSTAAQAGIATTMNSIAGGAQAIGQSLSTTNVNNNSILVREPYQSQYSMNYLTAFMGDSQNSTLGDFGGSAINFSVEQITPNPFSSDVREDLYEAAPEASVRPPKQFIDPISGSATSVYWVGYFDLSPSGVLTFTRATAALPPAPALTITRSGGTNTISFTATNTATYGLIFTNLPGLSAPRSNWITLGSSITGFSGPTNFIDTTVTPGRVYSVTAH